MSTAPEANRVAAPAAAPQDHRWADRYIAGRLLDAPGLTPDAFQCIPPPEAGGPSDAEREEAYKAVRVATAQALTAPGAVVQRLALAEAVLRCARLSYEAVEVRDVIGAPPLEAKKPEAEAKSEGYALGAC